MTWIAPQTPPDEDPDPLAPSYRAELDLVRECIPEALTPDRLRELRAREARLCLLLGVTMSVRQWPATTLGTAWMTYDPDDGWTEHDDPADAERTFGAIVDHLRDEASESWHESADTAAWGIWIPIERLRLVATAWPDDDTEDGERCRDAGWGAILDGVVERVEADGAALDFCGRRAAAAIAALRAERDEARAEVERLRAPVVVDATIDYAHPSNVGHILAHVRERRPGVAVSLYYHPDAGAGWCGEIDDWHTYGTLPDVLRAMVGRVSDG